MCASPLFGARSLGRRSLTRFAHGWCTLLWACKGAAADAHALGAGSARVPATGFKSMRTPVTITRASEMRLPSAHTCANQLVLSEYTDKELLRQHIQEVLQQPAAFHFR